MEVELILDRGAAAKAGIDYGALEQNLQAEIDKLVVRDGVTSNAPERTPAPADAQGDHTLVQWLLHIAAEPTMAKTYANGLVFALNEIVGAVRSRGSSEGSSLGGASANDVPPASLRVRLAKLGKEITLPTTTAAIQAFLENLGGS